MNINRRRQRNAMNIAVIVMFLALSVLVISQTFGTPRTDSSRSGDVPQPAPVTNPIIEENKKPGTDKWQSPNHNDYLQKMADEQRKRMEGTPSAADR